MSGEEDGGDEQGEDEVESQEEEEDDEDANGQQRPTLCKPGLNLINVNYMHLPKKRKHDKCGYCKSQKPNPGSATWGIGAPRLSVTDYQTMMDRGWRRCGTYIYKYDLEQSCC